LPFHFGHFAPRFSPPPFMAVSGDDASRADTLESIRAFNKKWPEIAITSKSLQTSIASRARYSEAAENGIQLNRKIAARVKAAVGE
jgi:hypothetical protein